MHIFRYDSVESTNETAKRLISDAGVRGPACVIAREQTAGKGTRGRKWASPRDAGLYLSLLETPDSTPLSPDEKLDAAAFTLAAGVACVECLRRLFGVGVELKPVNDLYVEGRKLGGILTEAIIECGRMTALITGIGINIGCAERAVSEAHAAPIALEEVLGPTVIRQLDADALACAIANDVHALNQTVLRGEVEKVRWAWAQYRITEENVVRS